MTMQLASYNHMIKTAVVYKTKKNPPALKHKNKCLYNTWVTDVIFQEWFNCWFVPEVKKYLDTEGLPFKVTENYLVLISNTPGH